MLNDEKPWAEGNENIDEFTHATLATPQQAENSKPSWIGNRPKHQVNRIGGRCLHIYAYTNICLRAKMVNPTGMKESFKKP